MKTVYQMQGYTLHLIPTKKFKTITISLRMQSPLLKETTTLRTLLTFVLIAATKQYPSTKLLASYLDENYGARLSTNVMTKGQSQIMNIYTSFVNDVYLPQKEQLLEKQIQLLSDLFFNPYIMNDAFDDTIVELKKKELKERLQVAKDDKFSYSLDKLFEYMGKDQTLGIPSTGYENEIESVSAKTLYEYFLKCIQEDEKHIYIVGDIDEEIVKIFKKYLQFPENSKDYPSAYTFTSDRNDVLEVIEKQDITQSKLNLGYRIDCNFTSDNHYAFTVFNAIFGGFSQSRLFQVVREENSLCYYVSSSYDAFNGMMLVNAGIEAADYHKTMDLITQELEKIQKGELAQHDIEIAKMMLENALRKTNDEAGSMITLTYNRDITHKQETNDEYIEKLLNVKKEDIIAVAKQVQLDTIFFLTGKDFDENN
ncbi:EF-P 5-aminopentanol modification-associated protein YfmF [Candidatus Stoquefichus massiliensis]|uniref:EF-P 5-aminopentanol modification-associated protein YfmF n=1 Tax=Candidatus Stoquefichus massiliensis TaxID=1470350 RepID=UPI000480C65D|nr:pitrilysin family protein [Candidatus Stoquefichus massiliensis]